LFLVVALDLMNLQGGKVTIARPNEVKVIARIRIKTDKLVSEVLAQILRTNIVPDV